MNLYEPPPSKFVVRKSGLKGGTTENAVFVDENNKEWFFKFQPRFQTLADVTASIVARQTGIPTPVVYARDFVWQNQRLCGSIQPCLQNRIAHPTLSADLSELSSEQLESLQRHHVVDWLLGNPDAHRGQFMVLDDGTLVGIDKTQALRFFPYDKLRWGISYWPINTRWMVYGYLFQRVREGRLTIDPTAAIDFAHQVQQRVPREWLREVWRPYISLWPTSRLRYAFGSVTVPGDCVELILDKIAARRDNLTDAFIRLYYEKSEGLWELPGTAIVKRGK